MRRHNAKTWDICYPPTLMLVCLLVIHFFFLFMADIRVATLNINGGRDSRKRAHVYETMKLKVADVIFLQETHSDAKNATDWAKEWDGLTFLSHNTSDSAGVALLFSRSFIPQSHHVEEVIRGRLLKVSATFENELFVFVCVYAPTNAAARVSFLDTLSTMVRDCGQNDFLIIGGDFNCTEASLDRNHAEPHALSRCRLIEAISTYDLCDVWRTFHKSERQYTWAHSAGNMLSLARLDRFYTFKQHLNKFRCCSIHPVGFSDHSMVMCNITMNNVKPRSAYWHFNATLLDDANFMDTFACLWNVIRAEKNLYTSLSQWWDISKVKIKQFCREYTLYVTKDIAKSLKGLEIEIMDIQKPATPASRRPLIETYKAKKVALFELLKVNAQGALIRSRFRNISEMDAPSKFFFSLEQKNSQKRYMHGLRSQSGLLVSDNSEIRKQAVSFFSLLFQSEHNEHPQVENSFFQDLSVLSEGSAEALDKNLSLEELEKALYGMQNGRAPGIDGLSVEFYKAFWPILGKDLLDVVTDCLKKGELPLSCRRAVITLLPKKGDLNELKNWRPVALLSTDYKILSKALASRLSKVMAEIIHLDQTYCVPGRSIFDNIHLVKGIFEVSKLFNLRTGLISMDQEKAFDRVEHAYLWKVLEHFGFNNKFVKMIQTLYCNVESVLKINGALCAPFSVKRGVRQGCSLSGMLYALAIEPLLCQLRSKLSGFIVPSCDAVFKISAYADDIVVMVTGQKDVDMLTELSNLFGLISSARVNWSKSEAFLVGEWPEEQPKLPAGLTWKKEGLKYLGVFLGDHNTTRKNWEGVYEKVKGRLSRWKWILPHLSYRGRVLIANNLAASSLWHKLVCIDPPTDFLASIQTLLVNFFWDNLHWLPQCVLYLPKDEGGQGLIHLPSRVAAFRLTYLQRFLTGPKDLLWRPLASLVLHSVGGMSMDKTLFVMDTKRLDVSELPSFYRGLFLILGFFSLHRMGPGASLYWLLEEPLIHGSRFDISGADNPTLSRMLCDSGIVKVRHLVDCAGFDLSSSHELKARLGLRSTRVVNKLLHRWKALFTTVECEMLRQFCQGLALPDKDDPYVCFYLCPALEGHEGVLLKNKDQTEIVLNESCGKCLYRACVLVLNKQKLNVIVDTPWRNVLMLEDEVKPEWRALYKPPLRKQLGDLQWRLLHGIIAINAFVSILNPGVSQDCPFCFCRETVFHCFMHCPRLSPLFNFLMTLFFSFGEFFSSQTFVFGFKYTQKHRSKCQLINFILGQAKMAIYTSRKNKIATNLDCGIMSVFSRLVKSRILIDFLFFKHMRDLDVFVDKWCYGDVLCSVKDEEIIFCPGLL